MAKSLENLSVKEEQNMFIWAGWEWEDEHVYMHYGIFYCNTLPSSLLDAIFSQKGHTITGKLQQTRNF